MARYCFSLCAMLLVGYSSISFAGKYDVPLVTSNGCTIFIEQRPDPNITITAFRAEGRCKNGLAEGIWLFGLERSQDRAFVYRAHVQGYLSGINFVLGRKGAMISVVDPNNGAQMIEYLNREAAPVEMERFLSMIDQANALAGRLKKPAGDAATLKTLVRKWKQGDDSVIDQWFTGTGTLPAVTTASENRAGIDDPKTRGRGAVPPVELQR